uniref:Uncharacterized protein n=1 Tax=Rhizophora mucronata TaxID=61149 RepID=A0A2P2MK42_RHIMU
MADIRIQTQTLLVCRITFLFNDSTICPDLMKQITVANSSPNLSSMTTSFKTKLATFRPKVRLSSVREC